MKLFRITRYSKDKANLLWMTICTIFIIILPFALCIMLYLKSRLLFEENSLLDLLFSKDWKPLSGKFGFLPFIISSLWITILSILISMPICILSAIYLTQYAKRYVLNTMHPIIDILAGIPSVIFGVWGILVIVPFISKHVAPLFGYHTSGYSIISASIVLSVMIIPFILNILIEVFKAVPRDLIEASLSLGATKWETIKFVLIRKTFTGIVSSASLGISRAFGETIAVLMVAGNVINIPKNIFDPAYPLPALIANNYGEMCSIPKYDSALLFSALVLFVVVLIFNLLSRITIVRLEKTIK